jgi:glycosyltransferase involved in cell wall biosynthesis
VQVEYIEMAHLASRFVAGLPAVYGCHEPHNLLLRRILERATGRSRIAAWYEYVQGTQHEVRYTRAFRHVVTLSAVDQANLERLVPRLDVRTINFGADLRHLHPPPDSEPEPGAIVFIGFFQHPPNADAAAWLAHEIMPRVRAQEPAATAYLVGRDPPASVQALTGRDGIITTGFVDDLIPYLRRASLIVAPIRLGGGLRGKILEAWAAGRPLVATRIAVEGFACTDGEHLLLADDAPAFAAAIVRVLRDRALQRRLSAAGLELAQQRYSMAATVREYERFYRRVLGLREDPTPAPEAVVAHTGGMEPV